MYRHVGNESGFSLLETLIAAAIASFMALVFSSMMVNQNNQANNLENRIDHRALNLYLLTAFANTETCTWQLTGKTFSAVGVSGTSPSETIINFGNTPLYMGDSDQSPILVQRGTKIAVRNSSPQVETVQLRNILQLSSETFVGELTVGVINSPGSPSVSLKPITVKLQLRVDPASPPAAKRITTCGANVSGGTGLQGTMCGLASYEARGPFQAYLYVFNYGVKAECDGQFPRYASNASINESPQGNCPPGYTFTKFGTTRTVERGNNSTPGGNSHPDTWTERGTATCVKD